METEPVARVMGRAVRAFVFDMDGVVTDTASVHAASWKRLFDGFLRSHAERTGEPSRPFDEVDYLRFVDGKPRYDGVRDFLESRDIRLPEGDPSDPPDSETVCGLGNRKNEHFLTQLREHGAEPYPSTVELVRRLRAAGLRSAVISSSRNMREVLQAAGVDHLFDEHVDGVVSERLGLAGKPHPAIFLEAAARLGVRASDAVVVEDAVSGVQAGRRGGFGLVVGLDRSDHAAELLEAGADVVVPDLDQLTVELADRPAIRDLPDALERWDEIAARLKGRIPAVFLDYDGTLTPIVERPEDAVLAPSTGEALHELSERCTLGVVSGRDLADVRRMVGLKGIWYAGSHGFDVLGPSGERHQHGTGFLPELDAAEHELSSLLQGVPGARVERKTFAIAVHYRQVEPALIPRVEAAVDGVARAHPRLRRTGGKKVYELRPGIAWDKGKALRALLGVVGLDPAEVVPIYVGDDETDEDAFAEIAGEGIGMVVRGERDERPTFASYALSDPSATEALLLRIARITRIAGDPIP